MTKADWREYLVAIVLFFIGTIYLIMQVIGLFRGDGNAVSSDAQAIHFNKYALLNEIRTYVTIGSCLAGAILLLRQKRWGWILCLSMILLFLVIAVAGFLSLQSTGYDLGTLLIVGTGTLFFIFELGILLSLSKKFAMQLRHWLISIIYCGVLAIFYFVLQ